MKITITATDQIVDVVDLFGLGPWQARVWRGVTQRGVPCVVFAARIAVNRHQDASQFDAELRETLPPAHVVDLHDIL